jgi:hypothetical protein
MKTGQSLFEEWYASPGNGDGEQPRGVKIESLDTPVWPISTNLDDRRALSRNLESVKLVRTEEDWIRYRVEKKTFCITGEPLHASEAGQIFVPWFHS